MIIQNQSNIYQESQKSHHYSQQIFYQQHLYETEQSKSEQNSQDIKQYYFEIMLEDQVSGSQNLQETQQQQEKENEQIQRIFLVVQQQKIVENGTESEKNLMQNDKQQQEIRLNMIIKSENREKNENRGENLLQCEDNDSNGLQGEKNECELNHLKNFTNEIKENCDKKSESLKQKLVISDLNGEQSSSLTIVIDSNLYDKSEITEITFNINEIQYLEYYLEIIKYFRSEFKKINLMNININQSELSKKQFDDIVGLLSENAGSIQDLKILILENCKNEHDLKEFVSRIYSNLKKFNQIQIFEKLAMQKEMFRLVFFYLQNQKLRYKNLFEWDIVKGYLKIKKLRDSQESNVQCFSQFLDIMDVVFPSQIQKGQNVQNIEIDYQNNSCQIQDFLKRCRLAFVKNIQINLTLTEKDQNLATISGEIRQILQILNGKNHALHYVSIIVQSQSFLSCKLFESVEELKLKSCKGLKKVQKDKGAAFFTTLIETCGYRLKSIQKVLIVDQTGQIVQNMPKFQTTVVQNINFMEFEVQIADYFHYKRDEKLQQLSINFNNSIIEQNQQQQTSGSLYQQCCELMLKQEDILDLKSCIQIDGIQNQDQMQKLVCQTSGKCLESFQEIKFVVYWGFLKGVQQGSDDGFIEENKDDGLNQGDYQQKLSNYIYQMKDKKIENILFACEEKDGQFFYFGNINQNNDQISLNQEQQV